LQDDTRIHKQIIVIHKRTAVADSLQLIRPRPTLQCSALIQNETAVPDIDNINHVGIAVRDLSDTAGRFEAMGFQLTPYSPHSAAWKPGEPVQPQGSGNRCVMFASDYLEILASEDPARPASRITNFLKRHQGAHIICFNTEDPHTVEQRLQAKGIATSGVIPLQREIDTPVGVRTAKFARIQFAPEHSPEGYIQAAQHLTPENIYQPRYTTHPNGCTSLHRTVIITDTLDAFAEKYSHYTGLSPIVRTGSVDFHFPLGTRLTIIDVKHAPALLPGTLFPPIPGIAAVSFRTPDLASQRTRLQQNGFAFSEAIGRLVVPAEQAGGVAIIFEE
jgi:catechol 2,3-dioxygenase-like lactoylglutathione lyase family enzyme